MNCKIELYSLYLPVHSFEKCVIHVYRVSQNSFIALFFFNVNFGKIIDDFTCTTNASVKNSTKRN